MLAHEIKEEVDSVLIKVRQLLFMAKDALDIYEGIREKASEFDLPRSGRRFWSSVQGMAVERMNLNVCIVFGKSQVSKCSQNSLCAVLEMLTNAGVKVVELNKLNDEYLKFKDNKSVAFQKLADARNNVLAHSKQGTIVVSTASLADIDEILTFGWDFCNSISEGFCSGRADFDHTQMTRCTREILAQLYSVK